MANKLVLLIGEEDEYWWLEQKADGSFWQGAVEVFASETEAGEYGWKVDAVKVILESPDRKNKCCEVLESVRKRDSWAK